MTQITTIKLDIAKNSFAVHGFDAEGKTVLRKELKRAQVAPFLNYGGITVTVQLTTPIAPSHPFVDLFRHLLGIPEQHHRVVAPEQRVVDAGSMRNRS